MSRPDFTPVTRDRSSSPFGTLQQKGVAVGAHPSFDDRENFGRKEIRVPSPRSIHAVGLSDRRFLFPCARSGNKGANHVKPHGALYNMAVRDQKMAEAIARRNPEQLIPTLILFAPANSAHGTSRGKKRDCKSRVKFLPIVII